MHIYSYENSAEWVAFLTFASMLMYTENEARLAVNMRKQSAFSAPIGSKNPFASWNERKDDNERINLYQAGNEWKKWIVQKQMAEIELSKIR